MSLHQKQVNVYDTTKKSPWFLNVVLMNVYELVMKGGKWNEVDFWTKRSKHASGLKKCPFSFLPFQNKYKMMFEV